MAASLRATLNQGSELEAKWNEMQAKFQAALDRMVDAVGASMGIMAQRPVAVTPEQRKAVFYGKKPSLQELAKQIRGGTIKRVVVLVGAGVSVAAGIPDFRSPKTGLYANLSKYNLPTPEVRKGALSWSLAIYYNTTNTCSRHPKIPQSVFDIDYFRSNPKPFHILAKELFPGNFKPTLAHHFMRLLDEKKLLTRVYTQNIDHLESIAGTLRSQ